MPPEAARRHFQRGEFLDQVPSARNSDSTAAASLPQALYARLFYILHERVPRLALPNLPDQNESDRLQLE
jgi:hypothetical protein